MKYLIGGVMFLLLLALNAYAGYLMFVSIIFSFHWILALVLLFFVAEAVAVYIIGGVLYDE